MRYFLSTLCVAMTFILLCGQALAQNGTVSEQDIEMRARNIGASLRCVVCQNQSIEESNAPLAADMRFMVREHVKAGETDEQIIVFMRDRYGDFVLLKPPLQSSTLLLWLTPFGLLFMFFIWYFWQTKRKPRVKTSVPLSDEENKQFSRFTSKQGDRS